MKTFALLAAIALLIPITRAAGNLGDGTARGGATALIQGSATSPKVSVALPAIAGHSNAGCADCRTVSSTATVPNGKMGQTRTVALEKHLCGDCRTSLGVEGHGKAKQNSVTHTCKATVASSGCCAK